MAGAGPRRPARRPSSAAPRKDVSAGWRRPPLLPTTSSGLLPTTSSGTTQANAIGMIMHASSMTFEDDFYHRRIPSIDVQLMDDDFDFVKVVVRDRLVRDNFASWVRSNNERKIVIVTMLRSRRDIDHSLHTTVFSRVHFAPDIAAARRMKQRINNELV